MSDNIGAYGAFLTPGLPDKPEDVTASHKWVAVISRKTVGWVEKAVGPFESEAAAQEWLDAMAKPGGVVPLVVLS